MNQADLDNEAELISRAAQGDINAFEDLYHRYKSMVYSVAYRITGSASDAEEATQDVFVAIHKNLKDFRAASSLKTWIYRIAVTRALNILKKAKRVRTQEVLFDHDINPDDTPNEVELAAENADVKNKADELLSALDADKRACLTLRAVEGLSYEEISQALGININTVRTRIKRAREYLLTLKQGGVSQ